jgi:hypothetical protein
VHGKTLKHGGKEEAEEIEINLKEIEEVTEFTD